MWIDMLSFMHEAEPYGHLRLNGYDVQPATLARMVGSPLRDVQRALTELQAAGVFSRTEEGTIFSRRMVRDEALRRKRAEGGRLSLNHPDVPRKKDRGKDTFKDTLPASFNGSFGGSPSSSSSSSSEEKQEKDSPVVPSNEVDAAWIESLRGNPAYQHIDIGSEVGKAKAWLLLRPERKFTKRFFVNWLNRAHSPPSAPKGESIIAQHLRTLNEMGEQL